MNLTTKNFNSHNYEYNVLKHTKPSLAFDESRSFDEWREKVKEKLTELLGLPLPSCLPEFEIEYTKKTEEHTEYRFTVQTEPGYYVPCHLLVPNGVEAPIPLTVCLSGHGSGMHIALGVAKCEKDERSLAEWHHRAMGLRSVKEGRAALVIEARSFGEASLEGIGTSCTEHGKIAILMGRTILGERVSDAMRILDVVLDRFDFINREGIVCTGNSGGGTATYYFAALDERIAFAAPSCSVCSYETSIAAMPHCMCNHIPRIRRYFEMSDLSCLIAPRKLVVAAGVEDKIFPINGTEKTFSEIQAIYKEAGAENNCALVIGDKGHYNYADLIWDKLHEMGV